MPLRWSIVSGRPSLANNIVRRLTTQTGSLPDDPNYGFDLRLYLSAGLTPGGVNRLRGQIVDQVGADPLVQSVDTVTFLFNQNSFQITIGITDAQGPFDLVLLVDDLTVTILNEGLVAPASTGTVATSVEITGGVGPAGPPGHGVQDRTPEVGSARCGSALALPARL